MPVDGPGVRWCETSANIPSDLFRAALEGGGAEAFIPDEHVLKLNDSPIAIGGVTIIGPQEAGAGALCPQRRVRFGEKQLPLS
jgi:hypothetical protein